MSECRRPLRANAAESDALVAGIETRRFLGIAPMLTPQPAGHYMAETTLLPLVALMESRRPRGFPGPGALDPLWPSDGCAGAIRWLGHRVRVPVTVMLAA
jgi:hypothetical protein